MPKLNTTVKAVRIDNDKLAELEKRLAGRSINSWMNEQISLYLENKSPMAKEGRPTFDTAELDGMASCLGISGNELLHQVVEGLSEGTLTVSEGKVRGYTPWVEEFEDVCHDLCIPVEKAVERAIKDLRRE